jgi:hypothetical protein
MDNSHREAFTLLGLDTNANAEEIHRQWRQLARGCHPDKPGGDDVMIRKYNEARDKAIAYVQGNSGLGTRGGAYSADSGCNEDWERRWFAQQTEFNRMEEENRQLREQNDAKDAVIRGVELKLEETVAELDQKAKQLVRSERERVRLEEKVQTLQASLDGEEQRAEIAEIKAKEWEQKHNENVDQHITNNVEGGSPSDKESTRSRKRKYYKRRQDPVDPRTVYALKVKEFIQNHMQFVDQRDCERLSTTAIYNAFEEHYGDQGLLDFGLLHFAADFAKFVQDIYPSVRHSRNNSSRGYIGLALKE